MKTSAKLYLPLKRLIGILGSIIGIIVCFALLWWWILIINIIATKGHPIFVQKRLGKHKKVFRMLKFRSMKVNANQNVGAPDMDEVKHKQMDTWFGPFLRKTSIDETLQLFNILTGSMAFVGPRPGMAVNDEYLTKCREKYTPSAYEVKPGITGYAQIKMKRTHNPAFKAKWDSEYVKRMSLHFDAALFIYTILKLFGAVKGR